MIILETDRLKIFPITYVQVIMYKDNKSELEKQLGFNVSGTELTDHLKAMLEKKMLTNLSGKTDNFIFNTLWLIADKKNNMLVADFGIKGNPDDKGEIELGYGTHSKFQNKGYMTEAIKGFILWASEREDIKQIMVETDKVNLASIRIVQKNNFIKYKETQDSYFWILQSKK